MVSKVSDNKSVLETIANMEKNKTTHEMMTDVFTLNDICNEKQNHFGLKRTAVVCHLRSHALCRLSF